ncbi:MAG: hypothetical protein QGH73_15920 [Rhodospirillales bacterium]|nr:hypothetical protein [Rhodospirillales bacterium]
MAGAFIIIRLTGEPEVKSTPAIMLLFAAIGVSIVALLGASASIAQLAGTLAAAIGGFLLWNWPWARYPLGAAGVLGGGGVLLSLVLTLGLFSEDVSRPALGLLILIFLAPPLAARLPLGRHAVLGPVVLGIVAAIPVAIAALIAFAAGGGEF